MIERGPSAGASASVQPSRAVRLAILAGILVLCGAQRVWLIAHTEVIATDGTVYVPMARAWSERPGKVVRTYDYPPGYPAVVNWTHRAAGRSLWGDGQAGWDRTSQAVSLVAGLAAMAGVYLLGSTTLGWAPTMAGLLLWGVGRKWSHLNADALSDSLAVAAQVWALALAVLMAERLTRRRRTSVAWAAATGLCVGAGYLVRPEALGCLLVTMVLVAGVWIGRRARWSQALGCAAAAMAGTLLWALPYMVAIGGISKKKHLEEILRLPEPVGREVLAGAGMLAEGDYFALRQLVNMLFEAMHPALGFLVVIWLVLALIARRRAGGGVGRIARPSLLGRLVLVGTIGVYAPVAIGLYVNVGYLSHRHVLVLAAVLVPLAGAGLLGLAELTYRLIERRRTPSDPARWRWGIRVGWLVVLTGALLAHAARPLHEGKAHHAAAGRWLGELIGAETFVMSDSPWVIYYSRRPGQRMLVVPRQAASVRHIALHHRAGAVALTRKALQAAEPALRDWLTDASERQRFFPQAGRTDRGIDVFVLSPAGGAASRPETLSPADADLADSPAGGAATGADSLSPADAGSAGTESAGP